MHTKICPAENYGEFVALEKYLDRENVSLKGAFPLSHFPSFCLKISRRMGVTIPKMTIKNMLDNTAYTFEFEYTCTNSGVNTYTLTPDFPSLCEGRDSCLFYYSIELYSDEKNTCFMSSINNVDFELVEKRDNVRDFRLVLYKDGFKTPMWAKSAVMYHVFVDRFAKSDSFDIPFRADSVYLWDWENGIPEYPPKPGDPLNNNTFFGGSLYGLIEKLPYLKDLGVNLLYLSPIFKAYSNHKYDTGDYSAIDEMFGGNEAFDVLIKKCKRLGIRVILDGVFNHTGDDSLYFNRKGKYPSVGAYQSKESPYHSWYGFTEFPNKYASWWGIEILPKLMNHKPELQEFFLGEEGIVRKWINSGTSGWRLDVADELPSEFLDKLRDAAKAENPSSLIIGEVWENAADKVAYSEMRRYFLGGQLDSVMNYPIKNAIIDYCINKNSESFYNIVTDIYSSYPDEVSAVLMNILGTHDTERVLTVLSGVSGEGKSNAELSVMRLGDEQKAHAVKLLKVASILQFTLPGIPSIYYGDEAGMEGYHDPFCRFPYPWGKENKELQEHYRKLCHIKRDEKALNGANLEFLLHDEGVIAFKRQRANSVIIVAANICDCTKELELDGVYRDLISGNIHDGRIFLDSSCAYILVKE